MALVFHFCWTDEHTPGFQYGSPDGLETKPLAFGENLSLEVISGPHCAGYYRGGEWQPCPHNATGSRKCEDCKVKEGLAVAQFCDGYNLDLFSAEQLEQLNTPHYVYLALFQRDMYKIGVSSVSRGYLRQIEQGTHFALVFAEGMGGILARQIETFFRRCGIPDKIAASQKKDFIFPEISQGESREFLQKIVEKYRSSLLFDLPEAKEFLKEKPEFKNFTEFYHLDDAKNSAKPFHAVTLQPDETVSGNVLAVKGPFIILETDAEKILINAKDLSGYEIDFTEKPVGLKTAEAFQGALF